MSEHEIEEEEEMSGDVQRARKAFAFSVESILARGGEGVRGDGGRNGTGAKRGHVKEEASLESKRAKLDELGKVDLLGCDIVKHYEGLLHSAHNSYEEPWAGPGRTVWLK